MEKDTEIKVLIVEDEAVIALNIQSILVNYGYQVLPPALTYKEAIELLPQLPDIALVDINLQGQKNGIDLAEAINAGYGMPFIFITANTDTATIAKATVVKPAAYLTKPFTKETLYASIQVALHNNRENKNTANTAAVVSRDDVGYFFVKLGNNFIKINYGDIAFIQFVDRYSMAYVTNGKKYPLRSQLAWLENKLSAMGFVRISKNVLVNIKHVDSFTAESMAVLGFTLEISRNYKALFMQRLHKAI